MSFLYHAELCNETDAAPDAHGHPGVRVKAGPALVCRLSPGEAVALAHDLLAAAMPESGDPR